MRGSCRALCAVVTLLVAPLFPPQLALSQVTYSINGTISQGVTPVANVTVNGGALGIRTSNGAGQFSYTGLPNLTAYDLSFTKTGYTINNVNGTINGADVNLNIPATLILYKIRGTVTNIDTAQPVSGVTVNADALGSTTTSGSGHYEIQNVLGNAAYRLTFSEQNYKFTPSVIESTMNYADATVNTSGVQIATISGRIALTNLAATGLDGVTVHLGARQTVTDSNGHYTFTEVLNGTYNLSAEKDGYRIELAPGISNPLVVAGVDQTGINFDISPRLVNPLYSLWNGFLSMTNVLELNNHGATSLTATVTLYNISGAEMSVTNVEIPASGQRDLIVNDIPGFSTNSYGIVKVAFSTDDFDGRMSFYRRAPLSGYEFAFAVPFSNPLRGQSAVTFNTFQPSAHQDEGFNIVTNWLSVVNLDPLEEKSFTLNRYDMEGNLVFSEEGVVPAFGRVDVDGGHGEPGPFEFGLNEVIPTDPTSPYLLQLVRYGTNSETGGSENGYSFAFPLIGDKGINRVQTVPISRGAGGLNFVEIANTTSSVMGVTVELFGNSGIQIGETQEYELAPYAQEHVNAAVSLNEGGTGFARITPTGGSILGQGMFYFYNFESGSVTSIYGSPMKETFRREITGSYNLFLGMYNWLKVINVHSAPVQATLRIPNPFGGETTHELFLPANASIDLGLHQTAEFGTQIDNYGLISLESPINGALHSELLRVKPSEDGNYVDFSVPTPVR